MSSTGWSSGDPASEAADSSGTCLRSGDEDAGPDEDAILSGGSGSWDSLSCASIEFGGESTLVCSGRMGAESAVVAVSSGGNDLDPLMV